MSIAPSASQISTAVSFARGAPSADLLPVDAIREAADRVLRADPTGVLSYGPANGYAGLREQLAARHDVDPGRILVTNGSLQGVAFVAEALARQGRAHVAVEAPTYDRSLLNFTDRAFRIDTVDMAHDGIDVDALEALEPPALLYTIPTFQNPAGCTLSEAKRERVAGWAAAHDVLVFEDDPYSLLRFAGDDVAPIHGHAPEDVIWSTSFTKTVAPGLRVGYLVVPEHLSATLTTLATTTYISPSFLPQAICADLLASGAFEASVARVRGELARRLAAVCDGLDALLPEAAYIRPEGGYFLWLDLPEGVVATDVQAAAARLDVTLVTGTDFYPAGSGRGSGAVRLAFSSAPPDALAEGVRRLAEAVTEAHA